MKPLYSISKSHGVGLIKTASFPAWTLLLLICATSCQKDFKPSINNSPERTGIIARPDKRPNIILLLSDDLGYEIPQYTGGQSYNTPRLNEMASGGMQFTQCRAAPLCSPSRFMMMTGKYNCRNYSVWGHMDTSEYTIGKMMRDQGYVTCMTGKWQFDGGDTSIKALGFDYYSTTNPFRIGSPGYIEEYFYKDPNVYQSGAYLDAAITKGKFGEDVDNDYMNKFLRNNKDHPFFLYWAPYLVHKPYTATPDDPGWAEYIRDTADSTYFPSMVQYLDKEIGNLLDTLRSLKIDKQTIILFAGDNGTEQITSRWNGQYIKGSKTKTIEYGIHVPMIAYWPGKIPAGYINNSLVDFTDFFPTIADLAGIPRPPALDGQNFLSRGLPNAGKPRQWTYCYYDANNPGENHDIPPKEWAQDSVYKLYGDDKGNYRFFHFSADLYETTNLLKGELTTDEQTEYDRLKLVLDKYNK